jgi:hypothetical protein
VLTFRCKEIQDREKRGRVDQGAAKRMVSSGLWQPGQEKFREVGWYYWFSSVTFSLRGIGWKYGNLSASFPVTGTYCSLRIIVHCPPTYLHRFIEYRTFIIFGKVRYVLQLIFESHILPVNLCSFYSYEYRDNLLEGFYTKQFAPRNI